ncbi:MAG: hydantoinase B/oxoprolinase family protein, partial [Alphaproteobacteria bacterium]|nr:hydantoinase B/oxoprolinase family protein [Alphaproteobacteria bacterium]
MLREGCVVGIPRHPTSCSVATTNVADRVSNPVQCALAEFGDGFGLAECGAIIPPAMGVISGHDPRTGRPFVNQIFVALTGGAGAPGQDAWQTICHVGNAGMCMWDNVEIDELHHPMFVHSRRVVPDTEGAGRFRGASSVLAEYGPITGCTMEVGYVSDGTINFAKGARGGGPGGPAQQYRRTANGDITPLAACAQVVLKDGESIISHTAGGGGYGRPFERDPERVRRDVVEGWISRERAAEVYGVVLDSEGAIDGAATGVRRAAGAAPAAQSVRP